MSPKKSGWGWKREAACALAFASSASCRSGDAFENPPAVVVQSLACGEERWSVKTGSDDDAGSVELTPVDASVAELVNFPAPGVLPANHRVIPYERRVYRVTGAALARYKLETDSDYHLVISDGARTFIAEIPAPDCVEASSPFAPGIRRARATFDASFTATPFFQTANTSVSLLGVGFFDFLHGQSGLAPNGFELHPVIAICFGPGCVLESPDGDAGAPAHEATPPPANTRAGLHGCNCSSSGNAERWAWPALMLGWIRWARKTSRARRRLLVPLRSCSSSSAAGVNAWRCPCGVARSAPPRWRRRSRKA